MEKAIYLGYCNRNCTGYYYYGGNECVYRGPYRDLKVGDMVELAREDQQSVFNLGEIKFIVDALKQLEIVSW